jgi:hypothetical protein
LALRVCVDSHYSVFSWSEASLPEQWLSSISLDGSERVSKGSNISLGFVVGALFTVAPLFGLIGTDVVAARAFRSLGPSGITRGWSHMLDSMVFATGAGIVMCPIGIIILVVSVVALLKSRRAQSSPHATPTI